MGELQNTVLGIPRLSPMLADAAPGAFDDQGWLFELKWDGYRCLAYLSRSGCYLDSRNLKPLLPQFPHLSQMSRGLSAKTALLDGEVIVLEGGKVSFSRLRVAPKEAVFVAFDLLHLDGRDMLGLPLEERIVHLRDVYRWDTRVILSNAVQGYGKTLFHFAKERGLEGIMAKKRDSPYLPGRRTHNWLKIKNVKEGAFLVVGFTRTGAGRLSSLVVAGAGNRQGPLRVAGRVASGLNREYEEFFPKVLKPARTAKHVDTAALTPSDVRQVQWVEPFYGVVVQYSEVTPGGKLRHPVFKGLAKRPGD